MVCSNFTLAKVKKELGINVSEGVKLFPHIAPIQPSAFLSQALAKYTSLAQLIGTEKAKSEFLVAPVLAEVRERLNNQISLFSGSDFTVDLTLPGLKTRGFLKSPESELQRRCQIASTDSA